MYFRSMKSGSQLDNLTLLSIGRSGDSAALGALFERLRPAMYATALRYLGYGDDARDAVQDAFLQALAKLDSLEDANAFPGWLRSIVERNCLMLLRRKATGPIEILPHDTLSVRLDDLLPQDHLPTTLNHRLIAAFHDLSPGLQETAALRYFTQQNSYESIAQTLAIPVGTVRSRLAEVRSKLKKCLAGNEMPDEFQKSDIAYAWEEFFWENWDQLYERPAALEKLYRHFDPDMNIIFTSGKLATGRDHMLEDFRDDMEVGIKVTNHTIMSTGKLTVIDASLENPPDRPDHCPPAATIVMYHSENSTWQLRHHHAPRTCKGAFGSEDERCEHC
jgi:RNA polymerase sigma factor (sigma-70 family)